MFRPTNKGNSVANRIIYFYRKNIILSKCHPREFMRSYEASSRDSLFVPDARGKRNHRNGGGGSIS